jgi:hypothetical protein
MNEAQTSSSVSEPSRFGRYFCGASPVLRALAWIAVTCLVAGWFFLLLPTIGIRHSSFGASFACSHLVAFISGISSFCPLGGISSTFAVLSLLVTLTYGIGGASC